MSRYFISLGLVLSIGFSAFAQDEDEKKMPVRYSIGATIGTSTAFGDVTSYSLFPKTSDFDISLRRGQTVFAQADFAKFLGVKAQIHEGGLKGIRYDEDKEPLRFQTEQINGSLSLVADGSILLKERKGGRRFGFDVSAGVGFMAYRAYSYTIKDGPRLTRNYYGYSATTTYNENGYARTNLTREQREIALCFPVALNLRYRFTPRLEGLLTFSRTYTGTDVLDAEKVVEFNNDRIFYCGLGVKYTLLSPKERKGRQFPDAEVSPEASVNLFFDRFSIGAGGGLNVFKGDIAQYRVSPSLKEIGNGTGYNASLFAEKRFKSNVGIRIDLGMGTIGGQRVVHYNPETDLAFEGDVYEASISATYRISFAEARKKFIKRLYLSGAVGVGLNMFRSYSYYTIDNAVLNAFGYSSDATQTQTTTSDLKTTGLENTIVFPTAVYPGIRLNSKWDIQLGAVIHHIASDKLDSFVKNNSRYDKYYTFSLGVVYHVK